MADTTDAQFTDAGELIARILADTPVGAEARALAKGCRVSAAELWTEMIKDGTQQLRSALNGSRDDEPSEVKGLALGVSDEVATRIERIAAKLDTAAVPAMAGIIDGALDIGLTELERRVTTPDNDHRRRNAVARNAQAGHEAELASRASATGTTSDDASDRDVGERSRLYHGMELPMTAAVQKARRRNIRLVSTSR